MRVYLSSFISVPKSHYYPTDWDAIKVNMDTHYRIPPSWNDVKPEIEDLAVLQVIETSYKEDSCKESWCALNNTVKSSGPAKEYGLYVSTGGKESKLDGIPADIGVWSTSLTP